MMAATLTPEIEAQIDEVVHALKNSPQYSFTVSIGDHSFHMAFSMMGPLKRIVPLTTEDKMSATIVDKLWDRFL